MKSKFPYCDQIKFTKPVIKPRIQQYIANHYQFQAAKLILLSHELSMRKPRRNKK